MKIKSKPIVSKRFLALNMNEMLSAIETSLDMAAEDVRVDFGVTTQTWNRKPQFVIRKKTAQREIYTNSDVYRYVDLGTKKHIIRVRRAKFLCFFSKGFRPKTKVGQIRSYKGATAGENLRYTKKVVHPGIQARLFSKAIQEKWNWKLPELLQRAINTQMRRVSKK